MPRRHGLLTEQQIKVLKLRAKGLSLRDVASILGVSHQNVALIEKRALRNVKVAEQTLLVYKLITSPVKLVIKEGTRLVEIPKIVIEASDSAGVRVRGDFTLLFKLLRFRARECVRGVRLEKPVLVIVNPQGYVDVYPYHEVKHVYESLVVHSEDRGKSA